MNAALRAHAILADPLAEWPKIEDEPSDAAHLLTSYVALLALIPALSASSAPASSASSCREEQRMRAPFVDGLFGAVFSYVMTCAAVLVRRRSSSTCWRRLFASRRGFDSAFKLAVYSYTPLWLAGIFLLVPGLRFLVFAGFYGVYLLWTRLAALDANARTEASRHTRQRSSPAVRADAHRRRRAACACSVCRCFDCRRFDACALTAPSALGGRRAAKPPLSVPASASPVRSAAVQDAASA